jgi:hypothetical protein
MARVANDGPTLSGHSGRGGNDFVHVTPLCTYERRAYIDVASNFDNT